MGKRELLILLVFAVLGMAAYHMNAPEAPERPAPGVLNEVWARMSGERHQVAAERSASVSAEGLNVLEVESFSGTLTIVGEDRPDVSASLMASVAGSSEQDARDRSEEVSLDLVPIGERVQVRVELGRRRQVPATLTVRVPRRLRVVARSSGGDTRVEHVAEASLDTQHGAVTLGDIGGAVRLGHRDGLVTVQRVQGPLEIESRRASLEIRQIEGRVTVTHRDGPATFDALGARLVYDGRRAPLRLTLDRAIEVEASVEYGGISITLPATVDATIDARTDNGRIDTPPPLAVQSSGRDQTVEGAVGAGGPRLQLRTRRGDIAIAMIGQTPFGTDEGL